MSLQSNELIGVLENEEAKDFITKHLDDNVKKLALRYSSKVDFDLPQCLSLLKIYQKAKHKIPLFVQQRLAMTERSYQQSSSQRAAEYKASLMRGTAIIDLCAGLGVDSLAFTQGFEKVVSVDSDPELHQLSLYNLNQLQVGNIQRILGQAEAQDVSSFDWIYLDPDRRQESSRKLLIEELKPNVGELLPKYMDLGKKVAIK